jgi:hypothetical protein
MLVLVLANVSALTVYNDSQTAGLCDEYSAAASECNVTVAKTWSDDVLIHGFETLRVENVRIWVDTNYGLNITNVNNLLSTGTSAEIRVGHTSNQHAGDLNIIGGSLIEFYFIQMNLGTNSGGGGEIAGTINLSATTINITSTVDSQGQTGTLQAAGGSSGAIHLHGTNVYFNQLRSKGGIAGAGGSPCQGSGGTGSIYIHADTIVGTTIDSAGAGACDSLVGYTGGSGISGGNVFLYPTTLANITTFSMSGASGDSQSSSNSDSGGNGGSGGSLTVVGGKLDYGTLSNNGGAGGDGGVDPHGSGGNGGDITFDVADLLLSSPTYSITSSGGGGPGASGVGGEINVETDGNFVNPVRSTDSDTNSYNGGDVTIIADIVNASLSGTDTANTFDIYANTLNILGNVEGKFSAYATTINHNGSISLLKNLSATTFNHNGSVGGTGGQINTGTTNVYSNSFPSDVYFNSTTINAYNNISTGGSNSFIISQSWSQGIDRVVIGSPTNLTFNYTTDTLGSLLFDSVLGPGSILFEWDLDNNKKVQFDYSDVLTVEQMTPPTPKLDITAIDSETSNPISTFNATVNGTFYSTTSGTITTTILENFTGAIPITVEAFNYDSSFKLNHVPSIEGDYVANLTPINFLDIRAYNGDTQAQLTTFNATIDGIPYTTLDGVLETPIFENSTDTPNIFIFASGFQNKILLNYDIDLLGDINASMTPGSGNDTISISFSALNESQQDSGAFTYNFTLNTVENTSCDLIVNGVTNQSQIYPAGSGIPATFTVDLNDGTYEYYFQCIDSFELEKTQNFTLYIDSVDPIITVNSVVPTVVYGQNLTGDFTFTDSNLFSYMVKVGNTTLADVTDVNVTEVNYSLNYDVSNLSAGVYTLEVTIADGHTANEIPAWNYSINGLTKSIVYDFASKDADDYVKITAKNGFDMASSIATQKQKDRYSFTYDRHWFEELTNGKDLSFRVESTREIHYKDDNKYKGWLIIPGLGKWIDFNTQSEVGGYQVDKVNDFTYDVTIFNVTDDFVTFESIGDLNIQSNFYNFSIFTVNISYEDPVGDVQSHTTVMTVNATGSESLGYDGFLTYNNTLQSVTKLQNGSIFTFTSTPTSPAVNETTPIEFDWRLDYGSNTTNFLFNHSVTSLALADCSVGGTAELINFLALDEERNDTFYVNNTILNVDVDIVDANGLVLKDISFGFFGGYNYSICTDDVNATFTIDATAEYYANGYSNRKYYLDDVSVSNASGVLQVNLYHLNDSKSSDIVMTVYDEQTGDTISDVNINVLRYYPETGNYRTVEIAKTDDNGQTLSKMILADVFYKFILSQDGELKLDTNVQRMLSTTKNFFFRQAEDVLESFTKIDDVESSVTCTEGTQTCRFTWLDTTGLVQDATLVVYRNNHLGRKILSAQTEASPAGTIVYTITENVSGNYYEAEGRLETTTENSLYTTDSASLDYSLTQIFGAFGTSALFPFMILALTLLAAFTEIGAIPVMIGGIVILVGGSALGLISGGLGWVFSIIVLAIVMMWKMRP